MKIIFMGSTEGSLFCLKELCRRGFDIAAVVTQTDKPAGRGMKVSAPPVKAYAVENNIPVFQPETLKDDALLSQLAALSADLIVVVAYGKILPESVLKLPPKGCINLHASLLPKYRGAAPANWAIINGEKETGITTQLMVKKLDAGDILMQEKEVILENDTTSTLLERLIIKGAMLLADTLKSWDEGKINPIPQDDRLVTFAPILKKEDGKIDWNKSATDIVNLVRGTNPWPGAYTELGLETGEKLKLWMAASAQIDIAGEPGQIFTEKERLFVKASSGAVELIEVQPENKRRMIAREYLRGYKLSLKFNS